MEQMLHNRRALQIWNNEALIWFIPDLKSLPVVYNELISRAYWTKLGVCVTLN